MSNQFLIRLRGTADGIVDLAENIWEVNGNVSYSSHGIYFAGEPTSYLKMQNASKSLSDDFTLAMWVKSDSIKCSYPAIIDIRTNFNLFQGFGNTIMHIGAEYSEQSIDYTLPIDTWTYIAVVRHNGVISIYINGVLTKTFSDFVGNLLSLGTVTIGVVDYSLHNSYYHGYMQDICLVDTALWTEDFTPPTGYLSLNNVIYLTGQEVWGINDSGNFAKLNNNYFAMTSAEKISMFEATNGLTPTTSQLKTLTMPIKAVSYNNENTQPTCIVTAIPESQTIIQKDRINLIKYNKITSVAITDTISGNGIIKLAVTKDNRTYQVYDITNLEWKTIDINDISTDGMSVSDIESLTSAEWALLDCMDTGLGFAYYLEMQDITDNASIADISINVEVMGPLKSLVKGTDYDYEYVGIDVLQVKLYKNGDFRINYNPG